MNSDISLRGVSLAAIALTLSLLAACSDLPGGKGSPSRIGYASPAPVPERTLTPTASPGSASAPEGMGESPADKQPVGPSSAPVPTQGGQASATPGTGAGAATSIAPPAAGSWSADAELATVFTGRVVQNGTGVPDKLVWLKRYGDAGSEDKTPEYSNIFGTQQKTDARGRFELKAPKAMLKDGYYGVVYDVGEQQMHGPVPPSPELSVSQGQATWLATTATPYTGLPQEVELDIGWDYDATSPMNGEVIEGANITFKLPRVSDAIEYEVKIYSRTYMLQWLAGNAFYTPVAGTTNSLKWSNISGGTYLYAAKIRRPTGFIGVKGADALNVIVIGPI